MSRWVDAEWLLNFFEPYPNDYQTPLGSLRACVDDAPSIDIVRCGECKYWKSTVQMPNGTEVKCLYGRKPDDFCSYGNSSEKPNNSTISKMEQVDKDINVPNKRQNERSE